MGGVGRAVVKIYHGRNIDHRGPVWRITQVKADKERLNAAKTATKVTGSLSGFERPLSERFRGGRNRTNYGIKVVTRVSWSPPSHRYAMTIGLRGSSSGSR
ncbi:hypothetical protein GCM10010345_55210 [Streptomyces canarius]|uniref:Transposase n=1 Tax=Streptomyces canarius TaxID=285453 RepID=A0ABQ3CZ81_9ACTN|nr:hypothetical protein GCM10010345_55210 [Streptomyces canarius]